MCGQGEHIPVTPREKKEYKCLCKTDETRLSIGDPSNGALAAGRGIFVVKAGFVKLNPEWIQWSEDALIPSSVSWA